ncbi:MAG: hypothetical protein GC191_06610 [Azospirillum sp.]|nr:hypothetical protein [Azospirillum sp.]
MIIEQVFSGIMKILLISFAVAAVVLGLALFGALGVTAITYQTVARMVTQFAAEAGMTEAQVAVGWMTENGWGGPADGTAAAEWYRKAAEHGDSTASYALERLRR